MSSSEHEAPSAATNTLKEEPLKLAVAISLLRSKFLQRHPPPPSLSDDALKWKRKAKERKQEILKLKDDLKEAEEASQCDIFPQTASCKCYFFDNLGKLSPNRLGDGSDRRFHDVLRRRFLRQVRLRERRRTCRSSQKRRAFGFSDEDQAEQLRASVDFLVELCSSSSPVQESKFKNWSHQAVDFILGNHEMADRIFENENAQRLLRNENPRSDSIEHGLKLPRFRPPLDSAKLTFQCLLHQEEMVNSPSWLEPTYICFIYFCFRHANTEARKSDTNSQLHIQHLLRKLGCQSYIGQRIILSISQRISVLAESLLFSDPFDETFPAMHECMFVM
ncbi:hypothetical protein Gorai_003631 [Gossypium raimondii]|uniref:Uncharacterized protein n=1 Tax=Gossypium raimondii TaxID=29730 RepID=A0A7J8QPK7_GOSRA|nr:hypothetical protein [Gossypium raimondii]